MLVVPRGFVLFTLSLDSIQSLRDALTNFVVWILLWQRFKLLPKPFPGMEVFIYATGWQ